MFSLLSEQRCETKVDFDSAQPAILRQAIFAASVLSASCGVAWYWYAILLDAGQSNIHVNSDQDGTAVVTTTAQGELAAEYSSLCCVERECLSLLLSPTALLQCAAVAEQGGQQRKTY
jgi:hypothetical protein